MNWEYIKILASGFPGEKRMGIKFKTINLKFKIILSRPNTCVHVW
jgi:hypothetical protein